MLNLFKKEEVKVATPTETPPQIFETGKEMQFKDPKTGEFVYQRAITAENKKILMDAMNKNGGLANQFMQVCRQQIAVAEQIDVVNKAIKESEKEINDTITKIREELKLDRRWGLNMALGVLERRDAPTA